MEMPSALLWAYSAERIFIILQFWKICGFSRIAFSREGSWRQTAFAHFTGLALSGANAPALPKGEPLAVHANFISLPRPLPLGEVASRSDDGEGEDACGEDTPSVCSLRSQPAPPRGRLMAMPETLPPPLKPSPWGRWLDAKRQDGRGIS